MTKTPAKSGRAPTDAEFAALRGNDATADGRFFYAIATTGVFCKPSCVSRVPKRENVRIFADAAAAEAAGFRPCKRCRPQNRSDGRRLGQGCVSKCKTRVSQYP